jgi:hypothetical protein
MKSERSSIKLIFTKLFVIAGTRLGLMILCLFTLAVGVIFTPIVLKSNAQQVQPQSADTLSPMAQAQINALLAAKESRTLAQQKIDSNLLDTMRMSKGEMVAEGIATIQTGIKVEADGRTTVDIIADVSNELLDQIRNFGGEVLTSFPEYHEVRARLPLSSLEVLASLDDVRFINPPFHAEVARSSSETSTQIRHNAFGTPALLSGVSFRADRVRSQLPNLMQRVVREKLQQKTIVFPTVGSVTSQGDVAHQAATVRSTYNVDGTGVKVGVISNSYDNLKGAAADVTNGDLPGPGNPFGRLTPVTIIGGDLASGGDDEGRAMLQVVHDIAPGAQLFYATGFVSAAGFATNIQALRKAGCDIIIDDVGWGQESPFQIGQATSVKSTSNGGIIAEAVNTVTASGALYFAFQGNAGNADSGTSGTWEGDFSDAGMTFTYNKTVWGELHSFGGSSLNTVNKAGEINLFWSDPLGQSSNDYDFFVLDSSNNVVAKSTNVQNGTQDPFELVASSTPNTLIVPNGSRIVIVQRSGAASRFLHLDTGHVNGGTLSIATSGSTRGHNCSAGALSVAASPAGPAVATNAGSPTGPYPSAFSSSSKVEVFSADGPRKIFFNSDGSAINSSRPNDFSSTGGTNRSKPDITAADGVSTTLGSKSGLNPFFGTSCAAPHAGAIAALVKSANAALTPAAITTAVTSSAIDIMAPGFDRDSGAGIIMADKAVQSVLPVVDGFVKLSGNPLSGVTVTLSGTNSATATTGPLGHYTFSNLPLGNYSVTVAKSGYAFAPSQRDIKVIGDQTLADFVASQPVIDGLVKSDGAPLSGVTVTLSGNSSATTTTDAQGHYVFSNVTGGSNAVTPTKAGYVFIPGERDLNVTGSITLPDFTAAHQYVAVKDFSLTQNPNGVWTYGYANGSGFHTFAVAETNENGIQGLNHWANGTGENEPAVRFNNTSGTLNYYAHIHHPSNELSLHPGPNCERSVVRFTAPTTGAYDFFGVFEGIDDTPTTTDVAVSLNGSTIKSGLINGFGQAASNGSFGFLFVIQLNAGDKIDFSAGCGSNNDYHEDSTGFNVIAQQDGTTTSNTVFGKAISSCGQAISGVLMNLAQTNTFFQIDYFSFTDATGDYSFPNVDASGTFTLKPSKQGYIFSPPNRSVVNPSGSFGIPEFVGTIAPAAAANNGMIVFQRGFSGSSGFASNAHIFVVNPDGTSETDYGLGEHPVWRPDGTKIAFSLNTTTTGAPGQLWLMDSNGTNRQQITDQVSAPISGEFPSWAPDGTKVVFVRNTQTGFPGNVFKMDITINGDGTVKGTNQIQLTTSGGAQQPAWQPAANHQNGALIAFQFVFNNAEIYTMNASNGSNQTDISNNPKSDLNPTWSPDGSKIVFASLRATTSHPSGTNGDIFTMNPDGSNVVELTDDFFEDMYPAYSPDGTRLVWSSGSGRNGTGNDKIFVMSADGCGVTGPISTTTTFDINPNWGPASSNPTINTDGTGLSPSSTTVQSAGGSGLTLTVNGTNFVNGSIVHFGSSTGGNAVTTFVNSTQLTAQIPASFIQTPDTNVLVYVINPNLVQSNKVNLSVLNPSPAIRTDGAGLSPGSATVGSAFTLTVNGTNFVNGSTVGFNGVSHSATFVSATQLRTQITATDTHASGTFPVTVVNPSPGGGTSNAVNFTVNCPPIAVTTYPSGLPTSSKVTAAFNFLLQANGGTGSYQFVLSSGALPAGLKFSSGGNPMISGIANTAGAYTFTFTATDSFGCTGSRTYTITIDGATAAPTNVGTNVTVTPGGIGGTTVTYGTVTAPGTTTATPIDLSLIGQSPKDGNISPTAIGSLPPGYQLDENSYAVDVATSATVTAPITVCLSAPWVIDPITFSKLRVLHGEQGAFIDRTISQNYTTSNVCAQVNSLSPFVLATAPNLQVRFNAATYSVNEGAGSTTVTVNRTGDTSNAASVRYATSDGTAREGKDYTAAYGLLNFAFGETSKTFTVLIIDNAFVAGARTVNLTLSNPSGATLSTQSTAVLTISDNDTSPSTANPVDQPRFFVQQHYYDFLGRYPDQSGWDFWTNEIASCGTDQTCIGLKRINVSAAYFLSIEFQQTGYLVERIYKTAYGNGSGTSTFGGTHQLAVPIVRFNEFLPDTQQIGSGVVVGATGWETVLENNKQAFTNDFVQRSRFTTAFPTTMTPAQFVDLLFLNAGVTPTASDRTAVINEFGTATTTSDVAARARALRDVAENATLNSQEFNRAFVLMQFLGYLRRDPNSGQDTDYTGFDFWLTKLNAFNGNFQNAEMVKAFITSTEYRQRFGP